jgi:hypothetical protein
MLTPEQIIQIRNLQIHNLKRIFDTASMAPVFKGNPKYTVNGVARIAYDDIMGEKYIIRCDNSFPESGSFWSDEDATIIAQYNSIAELVEDGWRLD